MWKCREPSRGQPKGLENFQIINIEEELKAQTRFTFKNPLKGTYKSQNLGKPKLVLLLKTLLKAPIKAKI